MTIALTRLSSTNGTQTKPVSFKSVITALESIQFLALQYDQSKTAVIENTLYLLTDPASTGKTFGFKSQMYIGHLKHHAVTAGQVRLIGIPIADPDTATAAAAAVDFTSTVAITENGNFPIRVGAKRIILPVVKTDTPTTLGDKWAALVNGDNSIPYTAANTAGDVAMPVTFKGTAGNKGRIFAGPKDAAEEKEYPVPAGLVVSTTDPTGGTGDIDSVLSDAWDAITAALGWNTDVVMPSESAAAMDLALSKIGLPEDGTNKGSGLWNDQNYKPLTYHVGSIETNLTTAVAAGDARREDPNTIIWTAPDRMEWPFEIAIAGMAYVGLSANGNPASKYEGNFVALEGPIDESNDWTADVLQNNVETALKAGLACIKRDSSGNSIFHDVVTTYHPEGMTYNFLRFEVNKRKTWNVALTVINDKLVFKNNVIVESVNEATDQPLATDVDLEKSRIVTLSEGWQRYGWIFNRAFTINNMIVELTDNPDRFNRKIPIIVSGNKRVQSDTVLVDRNTAIANDIVNINV